MLQPGSILSHPALHFFIRSLLWLKKKKKNFCHFLLFFIFDLLTSTPKRICSAVVFLVKLLVLICIYSFPINSFSIRISQVLYWHLFYNYCGYFVGTSFSDSTEISGTFSKQLNFSEGYYHWGNNRYKFLEEKKNSKDVNFGFSFGRQETDTKIKISKVNCHSN